MKDEINKNIQDLLNVNVDIVYHINSCLSDMLKKNLIYNYMIDFENGYPKVLYKLSRGGEIFIVHHNNLIREEKLKRIIGNK